MEETRKYCYTGYLTVTREMVMDYLEETGPIKKTRRRYRYDSY